MLRGGNQVVAEHQFCALDRAEGQHDLLRILRVARSAQGHARAAADRFASDSGSKVGSIRQANQGKGASAALWLQYMLLDLPLIAPLKAAIVITAALLLSWAASTITVQIVLPRRNSNPRPRSASLG